MSKLNPEQKRAVESVEGRVLVLAGAGSGKTSVLTERCIHLIRQYGVSPGAILGLTFTNKAAAEMRHRIAKSLGKELAEEIMLSTFHSFCFHLLKKEIHHLGYTAEFSIYDEREKERVLQAVTTHLMGDKQDSTIDPNLLTAELNKSMRTYNAVDFDGLLELTVELFQKFPVILESYQQRFRYIMIDEYQDTNNIQYELAALLAAKHNNLFVVGDDDQSIYSWRGSRVEHILNFKCSTLIKLEQNYRSTTQILEAANLVIAQNSVRHPKTLWSSKTDGDKIHIFHAPTEVDEAKAVVERISALRKDKNLKWSDFAILYRSNNLSRPFEMALMQAPWRDGDKFLRGIPYHVVQGMEFYERSEVKDFLSYLRAIANPLDQNALLRIINYPRRGISVNTLDILTTHHRANNISLWEILRNPIGITLTPQGEKGIALFAALLQEARTIFKTKKLPEAMRWLVEKIELKRTIDEEFKSEKARQFKWENIETCIAMAENAEDNPTLHDFLSNTMLDQQRHQRGGRSKDRVNLLTFHSAKGLEFTACFLSCLEERFLPHERSLAEGGLEEERRLFYVALTRAKQYLTLTMASTRTSHGKQHATSPSRFLFEIPKEKLEVESHQLPSPFYF